MNGSNRGINRPGRRNAKTVGLFAGLVLIVAGLAVLGRNTGVLDQYWFNILISWPMFIVAVGLMNLVNREYTPGLIVTCVGAFFLLPRITGAGPGWFTDYLPVLLIIVGLGIVLGILFPSRKRKKRYDYGEPTRRATGFVEANNTMGSYENIVLDELFTGAKIACTLGGTVLDLRHTTIPEGETYIDLSGTLAGVVIYVPAGWEVESTVRTVLGGIEDKRYMGDGDAAGGRKLVIRGELTLSGLEIKN